MRPPPPSSRRAPPPPPSPDTFLTRAERTEYRETSAYTDIVDFLERAAAADASVHDTTYGYTNEGRALPLAVVGDVEDPSPASVRASGKTVVYLQGNIHGGEVCGKEALQMLLRDLLAGRHREWRESTVLLIGTWRRSASIRCGRPSGRSKGHNDGFANWGFLADRLRAGELYPILRVPGS